jgi:hypothetical protein
MYIMFPFMFLLNFSTYDAHFESQSEGQNIHHLCVHRSALTVNVCPGNDFRKWPVIAYLSPGCLTIIAPVLYLYLMLHPGVR